MFCKCGCGQRTRIATKTQASQGQIKGKPVNFIQGHQRRGSRLSEETRRKISEAISGENHPQWLGDDVGYVALHNWIRRHKVRTGVCELCGTKGRTELANISGEYRRDVNDFAELCRSCHTEYDADE